MSMYGRVGRDSEEDEVKARVRQAFEELRGGFDPAGEGDDILDVMKQSNPALYQTAMDLIRLKRIEKQLTQMKSRFSGMYATYTPRQIAAAIDEILDGVP